MWKITLLAALALLAAIELSPSARHDIRVTERSQFGRGVNILGYDPFWKDPARARFKSRHFDEIRKAGFDFVRVNLFVFDHMDARNRIDPEWLRRLDWVVANATKAGLGVILDEHDFGICAKDLATCRTKLPAVWRQLAERYRAQPAEVAFELLNEPKGQLDSHNWNEMIAELLPIIRAHNPTRTVIVGGDNLRALRLPPNDHQILVTFHYYSPFRFTHQGAPWSKLKNLRGVTWGTASDREELRANFDKTAAWAQAEHRPILLGEFGAYDKVTPIAMRADYAGAVACEAERHGFGWAYWQFDGNFTVWDMNRDAWVRPMKDALINRRNSPMPC